MSDEERLLAVGRLLKPHGIRGEIKVAVMTDDPARFKKLDAVTVELANGQRVSLHMEGARVIGPETVLVKFREYGTPEAVLALRDGMILIPRSKGVPLKPGEVYFADMIGLKAILQDSGTELGTVTAILSAGNDLLEITRPDGSEVLIPWVDPFVPKVDVAAGTVYLTPPPGLLEESRED
ncbi:Ribosome maturation factor RimM [compost metagenome]